MRTRYRILIVLAFLALIFIAVKCFAATFETLTVTSSIAVPFTPSVLNSAKPSEVLLTSDADIRFLYSGGTPTSSIGHILKAGMALIIENKNYINSFKMIAISTTANVTVTYGP